MGVVYVATDMGDEYLLSVKIFSVMILLFCYIKFAVTNSQFIIYIDIET